MIIKPKVRGFVCTTAHPVGCARNVAAQIERTCATEHHGPGPKRVLVIGASTGYGLASRITAAFGYGADTLGVFLEKPGTPEKNGSAGWYNAAAFDKAAKAAGLYSKSVNADAFANSTRAALISIIKNEMDAPIDLVIYSLASPIRKMPQTGEIVRSALKPVGEVFSSLSIDTMKDTVRQIRVDAATEEEIKNTITVMGGEDWALWIDALSEAGVLADHAKTMVFSYLGTEITWPIYWHGTLGQAKKHLDITARQLGIRHPGLDARVGVMKSTVTQASAAIPVIPLYLSIVFQVMKEKGIHEGCIEQINRLFCDHLYRADGKAISTDESGRVRMDDWELREDVQAACKAIWPTVTTENLRQITDYDGYKHEFLKLFGFDRADVDYAADVDPERRFDCVQI